LLRLSCWVLNIVLLFLLWFVVRLSICLGRCLILWSLSLKFGINKYHPFIHKLKMVWQMMQVAIKYIHKFLYSLRFYFNNKLFRALSVRSSNYHLPKCLFIVSFNLPCTIQWYFNHKRWLNTKWMFSLVQYLFLRSLRSCSSSLLSSKWLLISLCISGIVLFSYKWPNVFNLLLL